MKKVTNIIPALMLSATMAMSISSCDKPVKDDSAKDSLATASTPDTVIVIEEDVWIIDENKINDVPLSTEHKADSKTTASKEPKKSAAKDEKPAPLPSKTVSKQQIDSLLTGIGYNTIDSVDVTLVAIPIEETQTVLAYNKKGVEKESFVVVSNANGDVEHIIFTNKKHKDIYDVQAGMTAKEAKTLRKELKHMVKNGQVFLYDDQSNIMYLLDAKDKKGAEVTEAEVDTMEVSAIVWKDKKHHKKK